MLKYIIRRLLVMVPVVLGVTVVISTLIYLSPGNPAQIALGQNANPEAVARLEQQMGLNKPPHLRYVDWLTQALQGNLGRSLETGTPVTDLIVERLPATLELAFASLAIMLVIALPLGVVSAVRQYSWVDNASMLFAIFWLSMPSFWLALILLLLFAVHWDFFPISGRAGALLSVTALSYLVLPAIANGARRAGLLTRMMRSSMLEILNKDYIRTAKGKGIGQRSVIYSHGMRNAMIPIVTLLGLQVPSLISSSVIVEVVFAWPGMGRLLVDAVLRRDYPVVQGVTLMYAVIVIVANLLVDIAYSYLDPQISYD
ncbi:ABC transporter permease [Halomarina oriensis]|uniref:ABC transporter permease subunit n=1 Tax=Halomarina oriensis TaxID=671145 RepID=A0A6B0GKV1_9EURY|nr:ABC transporter permease [Halomarina oriensis]MWG33423.1 ABC transporter permease subunit [Halomarina oriensis]